MHLFILYLILCISGGDFAVTFSACYIVIPVGGNTTTVTVFMSDSLNHLSTDSFKMIHLGTKQVSL